MDPVVDTLGTITNPDGSVQEPLFAWPTPPEKEPHVLDVIAKNFRHVELEDIKPGMKILAVWPEYAQTNEFREGVAHHGNAFAWFTDSGRLLARSECSTFVVKDAPANYVAASA